MSYIIKNEKVIASTTRTLKSGEAVQIADQRSAESIDANREWNLVNATDAKISNAKKWDKHPSAEFAPVAIELAPGEFYTGLVCS